MDKACEQCATRHAGYAYQVPVRLAHATPRGLTEAHVDPCIADLVQALNRAGLQTVASCCGHGYRPGSIVLADGRWITVAPDAETAERIEGLFPLDVNGDPIPRCE